MDIGAFHPLVVHFPIAGLIIAAVLDLAALVVRRPDLSAAALYVQAIAAAGAIASYLTGEAAEEGAEHALEARPAVEALLERHEDLGKIAMIAAVVIVLGRAALAFKGLAGATGVRLAVAALSVAAAVVVGLTGYYGGELVYGHGVGVATPAPGR